jgi:hypothetical protein
VCARTSRDARRRGPGSQRAPATLLRLGRIWSLYFIASSNSAMYSSAKPVFFAYLSWMIFSVPVAFLSRSTEARIAQSPAIQRGDQSFVAEQEASQNPSLTNATDATMWHRH